MTDLKNKLLSNSLAVRSLSALVLAPLVMLAIYFGGWFYNLAVIALMAGSMMEWVHLTMKKVNPYLLAIALFGVISLLIVGWAFTPFDAIKILPVVLFALIYYVHEAEGKEKGWGSRALWTSLGLVYLVCAGLVLILFRAKFIGFYAVTYLVAVVWATDIGAYLIGCSVRGPKLCPKLSPKKTWAGLLGGMGCAALAGYAVAYGFSDDRAFVPALVALVLALAAQIGDFFESYIKRRAGVKDSGKLIPGHGGLLDRIDGLLLASLVMFLLFSIGR